MIASDGLSRRGMLVKLGIVFNGIVGAILAVPVVRYILSPVIRQRRSGYESWLSLGTLGQFPEGQTRLATYRSPSLFKVQMSFKSIGESLWVSWSSASGV